MGLAQRLHNEGMQQGEATILLELIKEKFGSVSPTIKQRLEKADSVSLLHWSRKLLRANTIEEIFH